ncbi:MAG TPA: arginine deiminase family protein [Chryseolinea sp.]|nr:arginine deiminase family protein [Chryseolinea sp.]HPM30724.1 arginine deiminase family protein [Chryseolinea sp.]
MKRTCQSEYGTLESVFIKKAEDAFIDQNTIAKQWKELNFLSEPNSDSANQESKQFEELLRKNQTEIKFFPKDSSVTMDSIYCRDSSIATDLGIIICNMGKPARKNEPTAASKVYNEFNVPILGTIKSPGTVEGGDVAWLDPKTLAVGRTYRTNEEGIHQLRELLEPSGVQIVVVNLPHYKGPTDVFHLMSIFSPIDKDLAVVYSPLMPIVFREELIKRGYSLVEVPDEEFESMGCNVLAIAPRKCLMVKGNQVTKQRMLDAGCEVIEYEGQEISFKGGGGPTCLTRPMWRKVDL